MDFQVDYERPMKWWEYAFAPVWIIVGGVLILALVVPAAYMAQFVWDTVAALFSYLWEVVLSGPTL